MKKEHLGRFFRLNYVGLLMGFLLYCFSLTPSLMPRPAVFEGLIAGISFAVGYGLGVLLSWAIRRVMRREPSWNVKKVTWRISLCLVSVAAVVYGVSASRWQNEVRRLIGESEFQGQHIITIIGIAFVTATVIILLARLIYRAIHVLSGFVERWLPRRISFAVATLLVAVILMWFYNGVLLKTFTAVSNNFYRSTNNQTKAGVVKPTSSLRSGSDASLVSWDSLGRQGRSFIGTGPEADALASFNNQPAKEPIRVYIGIMAADTPEERATLALQELERTNAFSRQILVVMTATGTGWIEPQTADALEYIWNGDTALASIQYSYLPSWISFMVDRENSQEASRALFDAVYKKWQTLPADARPKLLVHGLSLGSYGAQSVFSGIEDLQNRTDGGLFVGTPNASQPWGQFERARDQGSPEWQPTYKNGQTVRFAAQTEDLQKPGPAWESPRIIYLQHASDPVVWWSPDLIWHEPDWLKETRGPDVTPTMQWYPFVSFFQVTVDQFFATFVPPGHGHNYSNSIVGAWTALVQPNDWNTEKAQRLQTLIDGAPTTH